MAAQKFKIALLSILAGCAFNSHSEDISFVNNLSGCVQMSDAALLNKGNIVLVSSKLDVKQPIAACGCKSALGLFRTAAVNDSYKSWLLEGKIPLIQSGPLELPVAADARLMQDRSIEIQLSCAPPE